MKDPNICTPPDIAPGRLYPAGMSIVRVVADPLAKGDFGVEILIGAADGMREVEYLPETWDTPPPAVSISINETSKPE